MTDITVRISTTDYVYSYVDCEPHIASELYHHFRFRVPGYRFVPSFKTGKWDGFINLYRVSNGQIYAGLIPKIEEFAKANGYTFKYHALSCTVDEPSLDNVYDELTVEPRDYQKEAIYKAIEANRMTILSPTGCHAKDDLILSYDGTWKKVQDIKLNDMIIGSDGKPKKVLKLYSGQDEMYNIVPNGNRENITVNGDHILPLITTDTKKRIDMSVNEYMKQSKTFKHRHKIFYNDVPINFKETKVNCRMTPYSIGLYIGDGSSHRAEITTRDKEIVEEFKSVVGSLDMIMASSDDLHFHLLKKNGKQNPLLEELRKIGLPFGNNKNRTKCEDRFIPECLFKTNIEYRYELLAGLIDSDGYLSGDSYFELTFKSKRLANDIKNLAISLGLISYTKEKHNRKLKRDYYRTVILGNIQNIPTRLKRKKAPNKTRQQNRYVCGFEVEHIGDGTFYGFEVEDNLYVTHSGMITHNSGKSLMINALLQYYNNLRMPAEKSLLVVPTVGLIKQMKSDLDSYGNQLGVHCIHSGQEKDDPDAEIYLSTWQSIHKMDKEWFSQFHCVIVDECHLAKAKSITSIMEKCVLAPFRFGFTGTLDGSLTNEMVIEGLFGSVYKATTTKELQDDNHLSSLTIHCVIAKYSDDVKQAMKKATYDQEIKYITNHNVRNKVIAKIATNTEGVNLVLFNRIDHGKELQKLIETQSTSPVYYVSGETKAEDREAIRQKVIKDGTGIIVASVGTFSTGINIPNLKTIIFATPSKSRVRTLQSIGRALRKSDEKETAVLFDIADDLSWKKHKNYTLKHFFERLKYYNEEQFLYKTHTIKV